MWVDQKKPWKQTLLLEKGWKQLVTVGLSFVSENVKYLNAWRSPEGRPNKAAWPARLIRTTEKWAWEIIGDKPYVSSIMLISRVQRKAGSTNTAFHIWGRLLLFWSQPFSEFNISPSTASQMRYPISVIQPVMNERGLSISLIPVEFAAILGGLFIGFFSRGWKHQRERVRMGCLPIS